MCVNARFDGEPSASKSTAPLIQVLPANIPMRKLLRHGMATLAGLCLCLAQSSAGATDYIVGSTTDLDNAIAGINADPFGDHRILIQQDFTLNLQVQAIESTGTVEVVGGSHTIGGAGMYRPFFIESGDVRITDLTLDNAKAQGGDGGFGGGGGLGAGAAIFVDLGAGLALKNVQFTNNNATGGAGGAAGTPGNGGDGPGPFGAGGVGNPTGIGGDGGFGGGGGAGDTAGGNGGFGGGGGGSQGGTPGVSEFGGGSGDASGQGGGGAAFGGALFVATGAQLVIEGGVGFTNNTVTGGSSSIFGGGGAADGADFFIMSGTQVVFDLDLNDTLTFSQAIGNDDGFNFGVELVKDGHGTLVLTGDSPWVSTTYVDRGTLVVDGALGSFDIMSGRISMLEVDDHGTLAGTGTIRGYVDNYGRISPGSTLGAIGTLSIDGIYMQGSEAIYEVDLNAAGQSDRIEVTYAASLTCGCGPDGGDLFIRAQPGTYTPGTRYTILTTGFGLFDTFGQVSVQGLPHFWSVLLEYDAFNAYLVLTNDGLTPYAQTYNQIETAGAVMFSAATTDPALDAVFTAMDPMTGAEKRAALDQLSGEVFGTLATVGFQNTSNWLGSVGSRLRPNGAANQAAGITMADGTVMADGTLRDAVDDEFAGSSGLQLVSFEQTAQSQRGSSRGSLPLVNVQAGNSASYAARRARPERYGWTGGYGSGGDATSNGNAQGLNYGFAGTSFGLDRTLGDGMIVGLAGGYAGSHTRTDSLLQSAQVNSYQAALYGSRIAGRTYMFNVLSYGRDDYKTARQLPANLIARGDYAGNQISNYFESGLSLGRGAWNWQPSLSMQYIWLQQDAFTETGAGGAGLSIRSSTNDSLRPGVGLRVARPTTLGRVTLIPDLHARYAYELMNVDRLVTANFSGVVGSTFTTAGNQLGRNFGQYGFAVNAALTRRFGCYAGYDLMTADRSIAHTGSGGLQFMW